MSDPTRPPQPPEADPAPSPNETTVVGIGASAGGLQALKRFFEHIPEDSGLAFVVVVHLSPDHESRLAEILQPSVKVPIQQVTETTPLRPNCVYVIPPNANLSAVDTHLRLSELEERRRERAPIDHFFRTLANTHDGHSVAVVLTGTGSDGTLGIREIKQRTGLTIAQDPAEAEYDGMPQSAIATGLVDLVLPVAEMPGAILDFARTEPRVPIPDDGADVEGEERQLLHKVFAQIRARTGRDFSRYKRATVLRRIARRMQMAHVEELPAYVALLRERPDEVHALADDLLITVTNFFRDPEVFGMLEAEVVPGLFDGKTADDTVRLWSVGCATGEEAYSLAILLLEEATRREVTPRIQVFASDLHERSLDRAREGFYPGDIEADVSAERLKRFFVKDDGGYRIRKEVRELVVFAPHNLLGDPPFSKLDLLTCRNVLIYLQREVQRDVVDLFHYALRPEGVLVLGTSETVEGTDLFRVEDKKHCVYRKRSVQAPESRLPVFPLSPARAPRPPASAPARLTAYGAMHHRLVEAFAPPSLLVSPDDKVVHLSEHAGRYLAVPGGELTANAFRLVRAELLVELRAVLHAARQRREPVRSTPVPVRFDGEERPVVLDVRPALDPEGEGFVLVIFDERPVPAESAPLAADEATGDAVRIELDQTRQRLQAVIEEDESSREELKVSNEELQSANEELRSTMEELETSKEELQSMNEELQTVNQENRHKVDELAQLSGDLQNLLAATDIATLFLDRSLRIMRFTPRVGELFNVRPADRGRPLTDLTHRLHYDEIEADAEAVLARLARIEREVADDQGRWYLTRVLPYRSAEDRIEGVVLTFVEITERRLAVHSLRESEARFRALYAATNDSVYRMSPDWSEMRELDSGGFLADAARPSVSWWDTSVVLADRPQIQAAVHEAIRTKSVFDLNHRVRRPDGSLGWTHSRAVPILDEAGEIAEWFGIATDVTARHEAAEARERESSLLGAILDTLPVGLVLADASGRITRDNAVARAMWGGPLAADSWEEYSEFKGWRPETGARIQPDEWAMTRAVTSGETTQGELIQYETFDGERRGYYLNNVAPIRDAEGRVTGAVGAMLDVTGRMQTEAALRESEERFRTLAETVPDAVFTLTAEGVVHYVSGQYATLTGVEAGEVLGTAMWPDLVHADDHEAVEAAWGEARAGRERFEARYRIRTADGGHCWVITRARPVFDEAGTLDRWFGTLTDVDALTRAEAEVRELNRSLEERVEARTAQVRELARALTLAEQTERRRIAYVLHDDLQPTLAGAQIAVAQQDLDRAEAILDRAIATARTLSHELSPPLLRGDDLAGLLDWLVEKKWADYGLVVGLDIRGDVAVREPDLRALLYQLLRELLFNVVKHAGTNAARIVAERDGDLVRIVVEDEGGGFDTAGLDAGGTGGLGLPSVRERLELVGGALTVSSAPGEGTRLTMEIPSARA